jgi:serine/threonine protein kinase
MEETLFPSHRKGNLRSDFKPACILFDKDGNAYLSGFGIADVYRDRTDLTFIGAIICILAYITHYPIRVLPISLHMDFYRRVIVLYTRLTDKQPSSMTSPGDLIARHLYDQLPNFQNSCSSTALCPGGSSLQDDKMCKERHSKAADKWLPKSRFAANYF